ncbi:MAG: ribonuclease P protein component [Vicinamibacteria bacterium]
MSQGSASLGKDRRIRKSAEFGAILKAGSRSSTALLSIAIVPSSGPGRIGISVPTRVGGSVQRNRARRRVREHYRQTYKRAAAPYDIVFNLKPGFAELSAADAGSALDEALSKAITAGKRAGRRAHPVH